MSIEDGEKTTVLATPRQQVTAADKNDGEREKKNDNFEVETKVIVVPIHCGVVYYTMSNVIVDFL